MKKANKKKRKSPLDLNEIFPDYFNKKLFRSIILVMILLFGFTLYSNDWNYKFNYAYCPPDTVNGCLLDAGDQLGIITLMPDSYYGTPPNIHAQSFNSRCYIIILLGFVMNHFLYYFKTGNIKPVINQEALKKFKNKFDGEGKK